jgi:signal transduction histidine kinase
MDEATLKRAFDPFFSCKPAGRRRGMGLAKALRWIESSGGSIRLESRLGQGTRAIVLLPASRSVRPPQTGSSVALRKVAQ